MIPEKCPLCGGDPTPFDGNRCMDQRCALPRRFWREIGQRMLDISAEIGVTGEPVEGPGPCGNCGLELNWTARRIGDGLCHICAHRSAVQLREEIGRQQAEIERLREELRIAKGDSTDAERYAQDFIDGTFDDRQDNA